jgi:hypothetical protein
MNTLKIQSGLVLVTSLVYLLIVTLAAMAVLESAGILAYSNANAVIKKQGFYLLEAELKKAGDEILNSQFTKENLAEQLDRYGIVDVRQQKHRSSLQLIRQWRDENLVKKNQGQAEVVRELLGVRNIIKIENDDIGAVKSSLLLRISVTIPDKESGRVNFLLQSLLLVPIMDSYDLESGKVDSGERLAWVDIFLEE